jgi:hypothetical protein
MSKIIKCKCQNRFFEQTIQRNKEFEIRFNDKDYQAGDTLHQEEWDPKTGYSGRIAICHVTFVLRKDGSVATEGLKDGFVGVGCWFEKLIIKKKEGDHAESNAD